MYYQPSYLSTVLGMPTLLLNQAYISTPLLSDIQTLQMDAISCLHWRNFLYRLLRYGYNRAVCSHDSKTWKATDILCTIRIKDNEFFNFAGYSLRNWH